MTTPRFDIYDYAQTAAEHAAVALLWQATDASENGGDGFPISDGGNEYSERVVNEIPELTEKVTAFVRANYNLLMHAGVTPEQAGHDLILTSNHHGAGFWDRGLGAAGDLLTDATRDYEYDFDAEFILNDDDEITWLMVMNHVLVDTEGLSS